MSLLGAHYLPQLDEVRAEVESLEVQVVAGGRLWAREWAATRVRACMEVVRETRASAESDPRFDKRRIASRLALADRLLARLDALRARLVELDDAELGERRAALAARAYTGADLKRDLAGLATYERDAFTRKLLGIDWSPERASERGAEMVYYEASSVSAVLDVLERVGPEDVLYDLGSGLGIVLMLASWLSPARAIKGVEIDPAYCRVARERIEALHLERVEVIEGDARELSYEDGTVFYFFHPFEGSILEAVLEKLRALSERRRITVCARGALKHDLPHRPWLVTTEDHPSGVRVFTSVLHTTAPIA